MFNKILSVFMACALVFGSARAELKVDIVAGATEPISIAVQKFEVAGTASPKDAAMIREVVENDLIDSFLVSLVFRAIQFLDDFGNSGDNWIA